MGSHVRDVRSSRAIAPVVAALPNNPSRHHSDFSRWIARRIFCPQLTGENNACHDNAPKAAFLRSISLTLTSQSVPQLLTARFNRNLLPHKKNLFLFIVHPYR